MNSVMQPFKQRLKRTALTVGAVGLALVGQSALAAGADTNAGTTIGNRATVSFSVGGVAQTPIQSSPTGNSTATGADTTFVVDRRLNFTVAEVGGAATTVSPGQTNQVTTFTISNTTNGAVGFVLAGANVGGTVFGNADAFDVSNLRVFVDANANGVYDAGTDTATSVASLGEDASVTVFIVSDVPLSAANAQAAHVRLTAQATAENSTTVLTQNTGADDPTQVDTVFADAGNDNSEFADDSYLVSSAALAVAKTLAVISDPITGTSPNAKPIPGAVVEYAVAITNTGGAPATGVSFVDDLNANLDLAQGTYNAGASNVSITNNGSTTFCVAEAGGVDTNADGCVLVGAQLRVIPAAAVTVGNTAPNNVATFRFRVTIK